MPQDIVGHIVEFSTDQYGSRFIQTKLEGAGLDKIRVVYDEIVPLYAMKLMQDVFGNYASFFFFSIFDLGDATLICLSS